jgi:hypothetical protein
MRIYKYPFGFQVRKPIVMPKGATILSVQTQNNEPVLWALVDPEAEDVVRVFRIVLTGEELSNEEAATLKYVDTFLLSSGHFVGHVFEFVE